MRSAWVARSVVASGWSNSGRRANRHLSVPKTVTCLSQPSAFATASDGTATAKGTSRPHQQGALGDEEETAGWLHPYRADDRRCHHRHSCCCRDCRLHGLHEEGQEDGSLAAAQQPRQEGEGLLDREVAAAERQLDGEPPRCGWWCVLGGGWQVRDGGAEHVGGRSGVGSARLPHRSGSAVLVSLHVHLGDRGERDGRG